MVWTEPIRPAQTVWRGGGGPVDSFTVAGDGC